MKKRVLSLLLCFVLLLLFSSCATERHELLSQVAVAPHTFCVRGRGDRVKQVVVKSGDEVIFAAKVKVARDVGAMGGTYGLKVLDLNFDGHQDFIIADAVGGDEVSYLCWLFNPTSGTFESSADLSGLCNVHADAELKAIFAFSHTYVSEREYEDVPESHTSTDTSTKYLWKNGKLVPSIRASVTYYSQSDLYCYSVSYYDEELGKYTDSDDKWLTPEEYASYDMSFLYYFK